MNSKQEQVRLPEKLMHLLPRDAKKIEKSEEDILSRALVFEALKHGNVIHVGRTVEKKTLDAKNLIEDVAVLLQEAYEHHGTLRDLIDKGNVRAVAGLVYNGSILVAYFDNIINKILRVAGKKAEYNRIELYFLIV